MPRRLSLFSFLALVMLLACALPFGAAAPTSTPALTPTPTAAPRTAQLSELTDDVRARDQRVLEWDSAVEGQVIGVTGGVRTGDEGRARLDTSEGSIIRIAANTEFELLEFPPSLTDPLTRLKLEAGKLWVVVAPGLAEGVDVETPTGVATVRGSLMSVQQTGAGGALAITCLEGACRLSNPASGAAVDLQPGQQSSIAAAGQDPAPPQPMTSDQYLDWQTNVPEAIAAASAALSLITPTPPAPSGLNVSSTNAVADQAKLAFDAAGALHLIWLDTSLSTTGSVFHRQLGPDGQWTDTENLSEAFGYVYGSLALLRHPDGYVCAFWHGALGSTDLGFYSRCQTAAGWTEPALIERFGSEFAVAFTPAGAPAVLAWRPNDIYFGEVELSDDVTSANLVFAVDAAGGYHAAWQRLGQPFSIAYRYSPDGGQTWDALQALSEAGSEPDGLGEQLVADASGGVHAAWRGYDGLYYRRWTATGGWEPAVELLQTAPNGALALAVDADARAHAVWQNVTAGVWYARQDSSGVWEAPRQLAPDYANWGANGPALAIDDGGTPHMVWKNEAIGDDLYYVTGP